ncbi:MAG: hypothetical protein E7678_03010 [Ruminococcaceae bacterium]|nr:hypothetical protein [Oscillospiraceae bacterium]
MTKSDLFLLTFCTTFVLIFGILIFIMPHKEFSESENRYLSKSPNFTLSSLLSGEYTQNISNFYTDQFPFRTAATSLYAISERTLGKKSVGDVICIDNQLIPVPKTQITKKNISLHSVLVDSKYTLFKNKSKDLTLYYKTDHHRTTYGAYLLYLDACEKLKIKPYPESYFTKTTVCENFYGTSFFKSQLPKFMVSPDSIELWRYPTDENVIFTVNDTNASYFGFYDFSKLDTTDKYAVFLGGNYAYATVNSNPDNPTLLLFKDSFANAVIPFLSLHFNIDIIDPRYISKSQLSEFYNNQNYDYRLFIGCLESFG